MLNRYVFSLGLTTGFCILTRENFILLIPFSLFIISRINFKNSYKRLFLYFTGLILILFPLFLRNSIVGAPLFSISNRMVEGLISGNAFDSSPVYMCLPGSMKEYLHQGQGKIIPTIKLILGDYPHFMDFVKTMTLKVHFLFYYLEPYNNINLYYHIDEWPWINALVQYSGLFIFALLGLLMTRKNRFQLMFFSLFLILAFGLLIPPILARYRLILIPFYLIWAGALFHQDQAMNQKKYILKCLLFYLMIISLGFILNSTLPKGFTQRETEQILIDREINKRPSTN